MGMTYLVVNKNLSLFETGNEIRIQKELDDKTKKIKKGEESIGLLINKKDKLMSQDSYSTEKINDLTGKINREKLIQEELIKEKERLLTNMDAARLHRSDIDIKFKEMYIDNLYQVLDKIPFQHLDNKSLVTQKIKSDIDSDIKNGLLKGDRSVRNYKRSFPLMTRGRDLKFNYNEDCIEIKWIEGINFKCVLGRPSETQEIRHTLHKVINGEYHVCDSSMAFNRNNNLILNLTIDIPISAVREFIPGRVVGVDLGMKIPAYCVINDVEYIKKSIGDIDDFLRVREQMQKRKRQVDKNLVTVKGGKGRNKKLQASDRFEEKEKNYVKTYSHFLSKEIVKFALDNNAGQINLELLAMQETQKKSVLRNWGYYQLQQMIEYKAKRENIVVRYVDPYHTSQSCSWCGHHEVGQRKKQETFICKNTKCEMFNKEVNADFNAARNIAKSIKYIETKEESQYYLNKESKISV